MALRVGHEKLTAQTGWQPRVSWEEGVLQTIRWYADNRDRWIGRVDWLPRAAADDHVSLVLVTGGGGFLGSHLVERLEADGHDVVAARSADYDLTSMDDTARMFGDAGPSSCSISQPRSVASGRTARIRGATGSRTSRWAPTSSTGAPARDAEARHRRHGLRVPEVRSGPFSEDDLWDGYPEETNAPYGVAKKAVLVGAQAYREQYGLDAIFLLPDEPLRSA